VKSTTTDKTEGRTSDETEGRQHKAERIVRILMFVIPALLGFLAAHFILRAGRPYPWRSEYMNWLVMAIGVSILVSLVASLALSRALPLTKLYDIANDFPGELESRFKSTLRAGNPKNELKRGKIAMSDQRRAEHTLQLLAALNNHEPSLRGHSDRVRAYATLIGEEMRLDEESLEQLRWAALLHDVGKLDVPARILARPEDPTTAELAVIKRHPANARSYLEPLEGWLGESVYEAARFHHEYWDGSGYPTGLKGKDIPLFGRIVAVADAFDVMTHPKSYKTPLSVDEAKQELVSSASRQFDPEVVAAFLRIGDTRLSDIRGWSASVAGLSISAESNFITVGSQAAVVAASVAGGLIVADVPFPPKRPAAIAFEAATTTTTTIPATSSTAAGATTEVPTTTIATTTTTEDPIELLSLSYNIKTIEQDGVETTVEADTLELYLDDELDQTIDLDPGQRSITVVLDVTDVPAGVHMVRFDLYDDGELVSTETFPVNR